MTAKAVDPGVVPLVLVLFAALAGMPAQAVDTPVTLKLWDHHVHDKKFRKDIFKEFNKANPDIFIPPASPSKLIDMGWIIPLEKVAPSKVALDKWMASFPQDQLPFLEGSNVFDGKVYSWPTGAQGGRYMLFWNKKLFREAGLPQPLEAMAELRVDARKITESGQGKVYGIVHGIKNSGIWTQDVFFPAGYMGWPMIFWPEEGLDMKTGRHEEGRQHLSGGLEHG